ncbi:cytochrome c oxidase subunit 3, partial [Arenibaculum sp.]|uniref:cytochrome c oxidase subunit 3 n=1 Tax=Arenibaculum sp. TaxID=2865862 RepID=UPI002E1408DB|nr:cytochrome c oxidase subunit 3 [Arenibaculum sp.]
MAEPHAHAAHAHAPGAHAHAADGGAKHPYHLVDPSPWPLVGSLAAGTLAIGGVLFMHGSGPWLMVAGLVGVLLVMAAWWRDVLKEAVHQKVHTPVVKIGLRYGMMLFIASEVMFFAAFFWAFFGAAFYPSEVTGGVWPPDGIETVEAFGLPLMMTLILLLSGTTVTWAHHAIMEGKRKDAAVALAITVLLGIVFTGFQAYEYVHAHFGFTEGIYPSTFYMATGFHGFHVIVGTIFLAVCFFRTLAG